MARISGCCQLVTTQVLLTAGELSRQGEQLRGQVDQFLAAAKIA